MTFLLAIGGVAYSMRLPWKQTAPIKRHAINLAAGLNSLCLQTAPGDFWRADICGGNADLRAAWRLQRHHGATAYAKQAIKNDRIVVSSAWLAYLRYAHHCFSLVT